MRWEMSKKILINQLFAGNYLEEGKNIDQEVINLFEDDKENHNLCRDSGLEPSPVFLYFR